MSDVFRIIDKYYDRSSPAYVLLVEHGRMVGKKSLELARRMEASGLDLQFIEEAALLHDVGIFMTDGPKMGCYGEKKYICHGYLGRELLDREGLPLHGLVCERHIGLGITVADIERHNLPLPRREMVPLSMEEKIICYADKFYSKRMSSLHEEKTLEKVRQEMLRYGADKLSIFDELHALFSK